MDDAVNFQTVIDEAKDEAVGVWKKVSQVTTHSHVMFYFYNATSETFNVSSANWDLAGLDEQYTIEPWNYLSFVLRADTPVFVNGKLSSRAKHEFVFTSDRQAFEFSTTLKIQKEFEAFAFTPKTVPLREHRIKSVGETPLTCAYHITRSMTQRPYHYGVVITLGDNF